MNGIPQHPAERRLAMFMRGAPLPEGEERSIVRHLLTGCPRCLALTGRYWRLGEGPAGPFRRRTVLEDRPHAD